MRHTWVKYFVLGFCSMHFIFAADEDSTRIYKANDIVVTATRTAIAPEDAPAKVRLVSSEEIQRINGTTSADILQTLDGVQLMDYGGSGGVKKVLFRGLSPENTSILFNGMPINDAEYGYLDLNLLPVEDIERVEVTQGGSSALFGGYAAGGVVNIITRKAERDLHAVITGGAGSFGARNCALELEGRIDSIGIVAGVSQESGSDDFPFLYHRINAADTVLHRTNADYKRTLAYWNGDYQPSSDISVNSLIHYVRFDRGSPGPLSDPSTDARLSDETFRTALGVTYRIADNFSAVPERQL